MTKNVFSDSIFDYDSNNENDSREGKWGEKWAEAAPVPSDLDLDTTDSSGGSELWTEPAPIPSEYLDESTVPTPLTTSLTATTPKTTTTQSATPHASSKRLTSPTTPSSTLTSTPVKWSPITILGHNTTSQLQQHNRL